MLEIILMLNNILWSKFLKLKQILVNYKVSLLNDNQVSMMLTSFRRMSLYKKQSLKYLGYKKLNKYYAMNYYSKSKILNNNGHPGVGYIFESENDYFLAGTNLTHVKYYKNIPTIKIGQNDDGIDCNLVSNNITITAIKNKNFELKEYKMNNSKETMIKINNNAVEIIQNITKTEALVKDLQTVEKELKNSNIKE